MNSISVSAPGKAVVSGEYAVLAGAPAIAMALDCRARVRIERASGDVHRVTTKGYANGSWRFSATGAGEIQWLDAQPDHGLALLEHGWYATMRADVTPLSITIDTRDFYAQPSGQKLGLGSSAAAMAALVGALSITSDQFGVVSERARQAHTAMQGGHGSGVDVATSLQGGVIEFHAKSAAGVVNHVWPGNLYYTILWSGQAAATRERIRNLASGDPNDASWAPLKTSAGAVASIWASGNVDRILQAIQEYTKRLRDFSSAKSLDVFAAGHAELCDLGVDSGIVYKPCGAGGGDIGIALSAEQHTLARFNAQAQAAGFQELPVRLDKTGISVAADN